MWEREWLGRWLVRRVDSPFALGGNSSFLARYVYIFLRFSIIHNKQT